MKATSAIALTGLCLSTCGLLIPVVGSASADAHTRIGARGHRRCPTVRHPVAQSRLVVVFYRSVLSNYYACYTPTGHVQSLGNDDGAPGSFGPTAAAGRFVAFQSTTGVCANDCSGPVNSYAVQVYDLRSGRLLRFSRLAGAFSGTMFVNARGIAAWIDADDPRLSVLDRAGERTLATGTINERSVRFQGDTLYWVGADGPHSVALTP